MKKTIVLIMMLIAGLVVQAQRYYFFCVNLSAHTDGAYVAGVIDGVLNQMDKKDEYVIYIRGGVNKEGMVFDAVKITDKKGWQEAKELLDYIDRCSVLPESEVDVMQKTFQSQYTVDNLGLKSTKPIYVYWFGDETYYREYGNSLFMPFYYAVDGERTWIACYLYGDNKKMKATTPQERLGVSRYPLNNVILK